MMKESKELLKYLKKCVGMDDFRGPKKMISEWEHSRVIFKKGRDNKKLRNG